MTSKPDHRLIQLDRSLHAVGAVIACAILLGGLLLVRRSLAAERTSIDARIAEARQVLDKEDAIRTEHSQLEHRLSDLERRTGELLARIPETPREAEFLAQLSGLAGESQLAATESGLEDAVVSAYFGVRQADEIVRSLEAAVKVLEENLRVSRIREESGELIRTERLNLEVELAGRRRELLAHQHQAKLARFQLAFLMGMPPATPVELVDQDPSIEAIDAPPMLSIENRPELQAARSAAEAAAEGVNAAQSERMPTVDAFASWQYDKGWRRDGDGDSWTAGLVMNLPIFDGSSRRSQVAAAKARQRAARENVRKMELNLQIELEEARLGHELALAQKEVALQQLSQAEEAASLSRERFAAGTLLSTELIGVETRLTEARVQLTLATAQERSALAHLRRVAGYPILD